MDKASLQTLHLLTQASLQGIPGQYETQLYHAFGATGHLYPTDHPELDLGTLVGVARSLDPVITVNKGMRVIMAQNLDRALGGAYEAILEFLAEVADKDVSAGIAESTFLIKNEAWVPLTVKFVQ